MASSDATDSTGAGEGGGGGSSLAEAGTTVVLETSLGRVRLALEAEKAPLAVSNFLTYVDEGFYDGTLFHRVLPGSIVQGGKEGTDGVDKPVHSPVPNESSNGLSNLRGTLAAARRSAPDSATSSFYVNVADNSYLDYPQHNGSGYTVFGHVLEGLEVMDAISQVARDASDRPLTPVVLQSARRE
jgi:peptidyl-prolyl cis-trans isomerase A (cyclophilin A)